MKNMATMFGISMFLGAAVLPRLAGAWSWVPMKTEALKACMVEFAKENGHAAFAERIAAEKDLTSWIEETIEYAEKGLARCEGADYRDARRHALLRLVDYPTHIDSYSTNTPVEVRKAWFVAMDAQSRRARKRVFEEVKAARINEGELGIFHFYNMGYILKGPRHAVALDVTDTPCQWTDEERMELARLTDFFVLTHPHRDHYSKRMLQPFFDLGKPVVLPCDIGITNALCRLFTDEHDTHVDVAGVGVRNYMGNQRVPCNVYQFDIDGVKVTAPGDNDAHEVYTNLTRGAATDIIISPVWNFPSNIVRSCMANPGFNRNTALFLPSHYNELGHGVRNRESYWEAFWREDRLSTPGMIWPRTQVLYLGESVIWKRDLAGDDQCAGTRKHRKGWL